MTEPETHIDNGIIHLGKIKVHDKQQVLSCRKKIYQLLLSLSFNSYKATLMASLFSQMTKHIISQKNDISIQLGIEQRESPYFFIQFLLTKEMDIQAISGLNTVFDQVKESTTEYNAPCITLEKKLHNTKAYLGKGFVEEAVQKVEIRSQEELYEELVLSNKNLEESLIKIEEVNDELEAFSYSVSHDLRAPLRHMVGFAELLKKHLATEDEKTLRFLNNILESSKRMGRLIDDLLSFSRTGRAEMKPRAINIQQIVEDVRTELSGETENRKIEWKIDVLPNAIGDHNLIRQVYQNLISNAIKYSGKKSAALIEIGCIHYQKEDDVYFVKDNGAGFDMQYIDKLFGIFSRLHRTDEFEGTGIGLANVRRIVHRHKGRVWAEAMEGQGATFYFTLPDTN